MLADPTQLPSVSFMDCQPPTTSSVDALSAFPIGHTVNATPHIKTHVDPSPPAEPPPSPPTAAPYNIPPGSIIDNIIKSHNRPQSPTTPFEFPFYTPSALHATSLDIPNSAHDIFPLSASIIWVVVTPRVFGIKGDSCSTVQITDWSLMDAGANICLTGDLSILADAVNIPPLPITVALNGNGSSLDDCCT
jgi:hypothetical protein